MEKLLKTFFQGGPNTPVGPRSSRKRSKKRTETNKSTSQPFNVCFFNAISICNKTNLLNDFVQDTDFKYDLIFIVETWLNNKHLDSRICPNGYQIIRKDRYQKNKTRGGGILLLYKNGLNVADITQNSGKTVEHLAIDVLTKGNIHKKNRFCFCYFPPDLRKNEIERKCKKLKNVSKTKPDLFSGRI